MEQTQQKKYYAFVEVRGGTVNAYQVGNKEMLQDMKDAAEQEGIYYLSYEVSTK